MNGNPRANGSRGHDPYAALRLVALIAAITGVIVLAAAAFVLSYGGVHKIALSAGVSASMARIFPVIFDAMLVVSCAAVLSLRGANWWHRTYAWLTTLVLLAAVAAADAVHATGTHIPRKPAAATIAVLPWVLLLVAFSLLLSMLRQFRRTRAAGASEAAAETAGLATVHAPDRTAAGKTAPESSGLDILEWRGPAPQTAPARTATQPSAVRTAVSTIPPRGSAPGPSTPGDSPGPEPGPAAGPGAAGRTNGTRPAAAEEQPQRTPPPPTRSPAEAGQQEAAPAPAAGPVPGAAGPAPRAAPVAGAADASASARVGGDTPAGSVPADPGLTEPAPGARAADPAAQRREDAQPTGQPTASPGLTEHAPADQPTGQRATSPSWLSTA